MKQGPHKIRFPSVVQVPITQSDTTGINNGGAHSKVKVLVTVLSNLCNPMDCSPQGSSVHGIIQASVLEWVAIPFSRGSFPPRNQTQVSCITADFLLSEPPGKPIYSKLILK